MGCCRKIVESDEGDERQRRLICLGKLALVLLCNFLVELPRKTSGFGEERVVTPYNLVTR